MIDIKTINLKNNTWTIKVPIIEIIIKSSALTFPLFNIITFSGDIFILHLQNKVYYILLFFILLFLLLKLLIINKTLFFISSTNYISIIIISIESKYCPYAKIETFYLGGIYFVYFSNKFFTRTMNRKDI